MIPFLELKSQFRAIEPDVRAAMDRVLGRGWYVLGEEVAAFEAEFAAWLGAPRAVGVASGTDAIALALRALGVGPGDDVIVPTNTCVPTVTGIGLSGARPVLADVDEVTLTLTGETARAVLTPQTRAICPVHLYGHPCDMDGILGLARERALVVVEDCAQAHGARYRERPCGTLGDAAAFSFYPSKNLGAYGDGGAVVLREESVADRVRQLRNYGQSDRYRHVALGMNSRLDEIQAAVLRVKLPHLRAWNDARRLRAERYGERLRGVRVPEEQPWATSAWHLYPVRSTQRDALRTFLRENGVATEIHYPVPIHLQEAYAHLGYREGDFPVAESACREVLSLPLYPELAIEDVDRIIESIGVFFE
jgi:dTDP-4-amino-4,6-dideoxygalactose transaminase